MKQIRAIIIGAIFAAATILAAAYITTIIVGGYIHHPLEPAPWLFKVATIPILLASLYFANSGFRRHRMAKVLEPAAAAFICVLSMGAVMAPMIESLRRGYEHTNVSGYIQWSPVYATLTLPLTWPLAALLSRLIKKAPNKGLLRTGDPRTARPSAEP